MPETLKEFSTTEAQVRLLLATEERCRNDDKWLSYRVFEQIAKAKGKYVFIPFELFREFPSFETISRCRRKVQNKEGLYPPTDASILIKRSSREGAIKEWSLQ